MSYDQAIAEAFLNLHVLVEKARVPLECIVEHSVPLPRAEVLSSIAEDYLIALDEAIEAIENNHFSFGSSTSRAK